MERDSNTGFRNIRLTEETYERLLKLSLRLEQIVLACNHGTAERVGIPVVRGGVTLNGAVEYMLRSTERRLERQDRYRQSWKALDGPAVDEPNPAA